MHNSDNLEMLIADSFDNITFIQDGFENSLNFLTFAAQTNYTGKIKTSGSVIEFENGKVHNSTKAAVCFAYGGDLAWWLDNKLVTNSCLLEMFINDLEEEKIMILSIEKHSKYPNLKVVKYLQETGLDELVWFSDMGDFNKYFQT